MKKIFATITGVLLVACLTQGFTVANHTTTAAASVTSTETSGNTAPRFYHSKWQNTVWVNSLKTTFKKPASKKTTLTDDFIAQVHNWVNPWAGANVCSAAIKTYNKNLPLDSVPIYWTWSPDNDYETSTFKLYVNGQLVLNPTINDNGTLWVSTGNTILVETTTTPIGNMILDIENSYSTLYFNDYYTSASYTFTVESGTDYDVNVN